MAKVRSRVAAWTKALVSLVLGASGLITPPPAAANPPSVPERVATVRAALAQQAERTAINPDAAGDQPAIEDDQWGNWGNWGNWNNWANWNNWGNWGNWANWVNY